MLYSDVLLPLVGFALLGLWWRAGRESAAAAMVVRPVSG